MNFDSFLNTAKVYAIPVLLGLFFIFSLVLYLKRDKNNPKQCRFRLILLIISSITISGVITLIGFLTILTLLIVMNM